MLTGETPLHAEGDRNETIVPLAMRRLKSTPPPLTTTAPELDSPPELQDPPALVDVEASEGQVARSGARAAVGRERWPRLPRLVFVRSVGGADSATGSIPRSAGGGGAGPGAGGSWDAATRGSSQQLTSFAQLCQDPGPMFTAQGWPGAWRGAGQADETLRCGQRGRRGGRLRFDGGEADGQLKNAPASQLASFRATRRPGRDEPGRPAPPKTAPMSGIP